MGVWGSFGEVSGRSWGFLGGAQGNSGEPWGAVGGVWGGPGRIQGGREGLGAALGGPPGRHGRRWWSLGGSLGSLWGSPGCSGGTLRASFGESLELLGAFASFQVCLGRRAEPFRKRQKHLLFQRFFDGRRALKALPGVPGASWRCPEALRRGLGGAWGMPGLPLGALVAPWESLGALLGGPGGSRAMLVELRRAWGGPGRPRGQKRWKT